MTHKVHVYATRVSTYIHHVNCVQRACYVLILITMEFLTYNKVSWRKASADKVLTVGLMDFVNDPRMEVEHPPDSTQWNLVIRNLQREDAGVYECQVSSKIRHLRHYVTLLVQGKTGTVLSSCQSAKMILTLSVHVFLCMLYIYMQ